MKEIILIKNGELALKGLNRSTFEDILIKNVRRTLGSLGKFTYNKSQSTITVTPCGEDIDLDDAVQRIKKVFGIAAFSRAAVANKDMEEIKRVSIEYLAHELEDVSTFKVEARRSDKRFALKSPEICCDLGEVLLNEFPHLKVDVKNPEIVVMVEVRDTATYIHGKQIKGAGGMPIGSGGKAALLISGGIDSPVAGWMMAKRGIELTGIHFVSPPYTSERAEMKVIDLMTQVSKYSGKTALFIVPFTNIQELIAKNCPEDLFTIIMRRFMMRIAQRIAVRQGCGALITGESVGQVASQTMGAIACTDAVCEIPVFRPCIGMDKDEIITISRKIETFDISIMPFEDCCTVFTPKHPRTRPKIEQVIEAENALDIETLVEQAVNDTKFRIIG
jgi:tRNA uracil 4-sulfurtransferase